jgi:hypothetical protein
MTQMVVDSKVRAMFPNLNQPIELCDEEGRVLGYFQPVGEDKSLYGKVQVPFTDEEIREMMKEPAEGRPLAEILADLEKRA